MKCLGSGLIVCLPSFSTQEKWAARGLRGQRLSGGGGTNRSSDFPAAESWAAPSPSARYSPTHTKEQVLLPEPELTLFSFSELTRVVG